MTFIVIVRHRCLSDDFFQKRCMRRCNGDGEWSREGEVCDASTYLVSDEAKRQAANNGGCVADGDEVRGKVIRDHPVKDHPRQ
jgi:hypothetical protein